MSNIASITFIALACISLGVAVWQYIVAMRFPLHQRRTLDSGFAPGVTLLKPLKGRDALTEGCLRSWMQQEYAGPIQILFGIATLDDPAWACVKKIVAEFPNRDMQVLHCPENLGPNAKVSSLIQLCRHAKHDLIVVSDADVFAPADYLNNCISYFKNRETGLVTAFYQLANPSTLAMRWEAVSINADFWSQVLQSRTLQPLEFALGAVMAVRRRALEEIGGFESLVDYLADDYRLGNLVARRGWRIALGTVTVECRESPQDWGRVWRHQLRWARTIRVCRPTPYFFSIISNATFWPVLMAACVPKLPVLGAACFMVGLRAFFGLHLQYRLTQSKAHFFYDFMIPLKDLLQAAIWMLAFIGHTIEWRGACYKVDRDGKLTPFACNAPKQAKT